MTLVVEDGTGLANADALVSLAYVDAYFGPDDRNNAAWTGTDAVKEAAIRRGSAFLSNAYTWQGTRVQGRSQALAWPRYNVIDPEGYTVPSDAVPWEIQEATAEVALRELVSPGSMTPDITASAAIKRQRKKVGEIETEVEYLNSSTGVSASVPILTVVRDLIGGLLATGSGNALAGATMRV